MGSSVNVGPGLKLSWFYICGEENSLTVERQITQAYISNKPGDFKETITNYKSIANVEFKNRLLIGLPNPSKAMEPLKKTGLHCVHLWLLK